MHPEQPAPTFEQEEILLPLKHGRTMRYVVEEGNGKRVLIAGDVDSHAELSLHLPSLGGGFMTLYEDLRIVSISGISGKFGRDQVRDWTTEKVREQFPGHDVDVD